MFMGTSSRSRDYHFQIRSAVSKEDYLSLVYSNHLVNEFNEGDEVQCDGCAS